MKKLFWAVIALTILTTATPAMSGILYYADCEKPYDTNQWTAVSHYENYSFNNISVSTDHVRSGSHSWKFQLNTQENLNSSNFNDSAHVHLAKDGINFQFNKTYWLGFSVYFPSDFVRPQGGNWLDLFDFHGPWTCPYDSGMPATGYYNPNGGSLVIKGSDNCSEAPNCDRAASYSVPWKLGVWNDVVFNYSFSYSGGGFFKMWLNGQLIVDDKGINTWPGTPYFKFGLYGRPQVPSTIYYDEIRFGDSNSSYAEVAPSGSVASNSDSGSDTNSNNSTSVEAPVLSIVGSQQ